MGKLTKLDVVNSCLASLGEAPVDTVDVIDHPFINSALAMLDQHLMKEQAVTLWFNTETITLSPDTVTKRITLPDNVLNVDPTNRFELYTERGGYLYDTKKNTFTFDNDVCVVLTLAINFEDCPTAFQLLVKAATVLEFQINFDGDGNKTQIAANEYQANKLIIKRFDTNNKDVNLLRNTGEVGRKLYSLNFVGRSGRWGSRFRGR